MKTHKTIFKKITKILAVLCVFFYTNFIVAQKNANTYNRNFKLAVGVISGLPLKYPYNFNLGGDVRLQYRISETYALCLTAGYSNLYLKDNGINFGYIPVKVGYKSFIFKNEFYVMGELGGAFSTTKEYDNNTVFFSPSIGFATKYVDISLHYQFLKDFPIIKDNKVDNGLDQLLVRLAYVFDL
jgi:hypothetical protein